MPDVDADYMSKEIYNKLTEDVVALGKLGSK